MNLRSWHYGVENDYLTGHYGVCKLLQKRKRHPNANHFKPWHYSLEFDLKWRNTMVKRLSLWHGSIENFYWVLCLQTYLHILRDWLWDIALWSLPWPTLRRGIRWIDQALSLFPFSSSFLFHFSSLSSSSSSRISSPSFLSSPCRDQWPARRRRR